MPFIGAFIAHTLFDLGFVLGAMSRVPVMNKFSTKHEVKSLQKRSGEVMKRRVFTRLDKDDEENICETPASLSSVVEPFKNHIDEIKTKINSETSVIKNALPSLSEGELQQLFDLFSKGKSGGFNEEKLFKSMYMTTNLQNIDDYIASLKRLRKEFVLTYLNAFSVEYHKKYGSEVTLNPESFLEDVKTELDIKKGFRRASEARNGEQGNLQAEVAEGSCCIM